MSGVCAISGRILVVLCLALIYGLSDSNARPCHTGLSAYLISSLAIFSASIVVEIFIVNAGMQGTMVEMSSRQPALERLLFLHYAFGIMQLALTIWGFMLFGHDWSVPCATAVIDNSFFDKTLLVVVLVFQLLDIGSQFFCCFLLKAGRTKKRARSDSFTKNAAHEAHPVLGDSSGHDTDENDDDEDGAYNSESQKKWEKRCSSLCNCTRFFSCGIFGGSNISQDIEAVAKVLTSFFQHDGFLDVVPSDVLAGILLVRLQQRRALARYRAPGAEDLVAGPTAKLISESPDLEAGVGRTISVSLPARSQLALGAARRQMSPLQLDDVESIRTLARMSKFAFAAYTHLLYLYDRPISGLCMLCKSCCAGGGCSVETSVRGLEQASHAAGDNCCHIHHAAAAAVVHEMGNAELIYASYVNDLVMKPYLVFLDHDTENVVIAVRGTLSLEDCLTDAICEPVELREAGETWGFDGKDRWAHGGMLRAAQAIRSDISRQGTLTAVFEGVGMRGSTASSSFGGSDRGSMDSASGVTRAYPHYGLKVVGHSLGAGTAVILSLLLHAQYPTLGCCGFGTPGSLLDRKTGLESVNWLTSVVLDNDIISRLGLSTLNHLREEVLRSITRAKINKTYIMRTLVEELDVNDVMHRVGQEPQSDFKTAVDSFLLHMRKKHESAGQVQELVLPGKVIALVKTSWGQQPKMRGCCESCLRGMCFCCKPKKKYVAQETTGDAFSEIVVSSSMALDHFPNRYVEELQNLSTSWQEISRR